MIGRILHKLLSADAVGLILLLAALQTLTSGIASSLRNTDTSYFFWVCCVAVLVALGLGKLRFNALRASAVMIGISLLGVWIVGARLTTPLWNLGHAILLVFRQLNHATRYHVPVDATPLAAAWFVVKDASITLGMRIQTWVFSLNQNATVSDPLLRNMAWLLIMWLSAAWIGWFAARRNAIAALMPSILLLAAITAYSEYRVYTLWLMVSFLLLLMGLWNYRNHTVQWERKKVDYSDSIGYDVGQAVVLLTIVIGTVMFITPSISWREIRDYLRERNQSSQNETAELLGVRQQTVAGQNVQKPTPALPREHWLTGGYAHSEKIVMIIQTGERPPIVNLSIPVDAPRHYWRSTTYDLYASGGWITSAAIPQSIQANTPLIPGVLNGYDLLNMSVNIVEPEGKLFWSGILFSADVPFKANWRVKPQSSLFADPATLLQADMFAAFSNATTYQAQSYVPRVTIQELRAASTDYPEEIRKRYLQLPDSVPERVLQLAGEVTKGQANPYDKAKAIESYLRTYPYNLDVPAPPEGQDVADYFLFDLKKGYCDYYATAMVVLARASGIPARFVSGYSSGSYDAANAEYIIRELNAHSWAELYFPEIGWVEFEPTAAEPEIDRPLTNDASLTAQPPDTAVARLLFRFRLVQAIYWLSPLAVILLALILYFTLIERWWYLHLAPVTAIERIYRQLYRFGRPLAGARTQAETAYEFMQKLIARMDGLREHSRIPKLLLSAQHEIELLTDLYQATLFRHAAMQKRDAHTALRAWKHLRRRLLIARINAWLTGRFNAQGGRPRHILSRPMDEAQ